MYRSEEIVSGGDDLEKVTVSAKVLSHERGEKLRVFKFKPKRGYRRRTGHRQDLTRIEVTEIALGGASAKVASSSASRSKAAAEGSEKVAEKKQPVAEKKQPVAEKKQPVAEKKQPVAKTEKENGDGA